MTETNTAQMVAELQSTDAAIRGNGWVAPGLGMPGAPMGLLGSSLNPLSGLAAAGLGWFMPLVSFLGDGLTQLQGGNDASVSSGSKDFGDAGRDIAGVADTYRASTNAQTSEWSGEAAAQYRDTGAQYADGIAGLGEGSNSVGSAIIGAGQVVAQAIAEVTELIAEAVAQIVPIMTQAVARAGETFGQSIAEAIPPCVGIAVEYALRIAAKLAALVASGDNLMKLVQGGLAVVELIQRALSGISQQSVQGEAQSTLSGATGQAQGGGPAGPVDVASTMPTGGGAGPSGSSSAPGSSGGGVSAVPSAAGGPVSPQGTHSWTPPTMSSSSGAVPPAFGAGSDLSRSPGQLGGGGLSGAVPSAVAVGAGDRGAGSRVGVGRGGAGGRGGETGGSASPQSSGRTGGVPGALPMGAMGAGRGAGDSDKEHQRKYDLTESHEEDIDAPPSVITDESDLTKD